MNVTGVNVNEGCCNERTKTIADRNQAIGVMLEEAGLIMSDIGYSLFQDPPIEVKRPESTCLSMDMELNELAMSNLLITLRALKERLF